MRYRVFAISIAAVTILAIAMLSRAAAQTAQQPEKSTTRRTLFLPAMAGFERNIIGALRFADAPVDIVTEQADSDLQVKLTRGNSTPGMQALLYRKVTGHDPEDFLDVVDLRTNRVLLTYHFFWTDDGDGRARDAQEFAAELKKKLTPKRPRRPKAE
jgi:hypothetical protein